MDTAACLFHYTTRDAALAHIVPTGRLRFSTYERMRDPLENKDWSWSASWTVEDSGADPDPKETLIDTFEDFAKAIRCQAHLLAFTVDAKGYEGDAQDFAKGWSRARMWEQYAENHAGVCLVFDRDRLTANIGDDVERQHEVRPYAHPVRYTETGRSERSMHLLPGGWPKSIRAEFVSRYIEEHHKELFFTKVLDWQTESEYRFVTTAPAERPLFASYGDALVAIVLGGRFPDWQRPAALEAGLQAGIRPVIMDWDLFSPIPMPYFRDSEYEEGSPERGVPPAAGS